MRPLHGDEGGALRDRAGERVRRRVAAAGDVLRLQREAVHGREREHGTQRGQHARMPRGLPVNGVRQAGVVDAQVDRGTAQMLREEGERVMRCERLEGRDVAVVEHALGGEVARPHATERVPVREVWGQLDGAAAVDQEAEAFQRRVGKQLDDRVGAGPRATTVPAAQKLAPRAQVGSHRRRHGDAAAAGLRDQVNDRPHEGARAWQHGGAEVERAS